jgi:hypothetical protein
MELTHLDSIFFKHLKYTSQTVTYDTLDYEIMFSEPDDAFRIVGQCLLLANELAPQHFAGTGILNHYNTETPTPVGGIHQDDNSLGG